MDLLALLQQGRPPSTTPSVSSQPMQKTSSEKSDSLSDANAIAGPSPLDILTRHSATTLSAVDLPQPLGLAQPVPPSEAFHKLVSMIQPSSSSSNSKIESKALAASKLLNVVNDQETRSVRLPTETTEVVKNLGTETISRVSRPLSYVKGKLCSNNDDFISYSVKKDGRIRSICCNTGCYALMAGHADPPIDLAFKPTSKDIPESYLLSTGNEAQNTVMLWSLAEFEPNEKQRSDTGFDLLFTIRNENKSFVRRCLWQPSGNIFALLSDDAVYVICFDKILENYVNKSMPSITLDQLSLDKSACLAYMTSSELDVTSGVFSSWENGLALGTSNGTVQLLRYNWEDKTFFCKCILKPQLSTPIDTIFWLSPTQFLIATEKNTQVHLWNYANDQDTWRSSETISFASAAEFASVTFIPEFSALLLCPSSQPVCYLVHAEMHESNRFRSSKYRQISLPNGPCVSVSYWVSQSGDEIKMYAVSDQTVDELDLTSLLIPDLSHTTPIVDTMTKTTAMDSPAEMTTAASNSTLEESSVGVSEKMDKSNRLDPSDLPLPLSPPNAHDLDQFCSDIINNTLNQAKEEIETLEAACTAKFEQSCGIIMEDSPKMTSEEADKVYDDVDRLFRRKLMLDTPRESPEKEDPNSTLPEMIRSIVREECKNFMSVDFIKVVSNANKQSSFGSLEDKLPKLIEKASVKQSEKLSSSLRQSISEKVTRDVNASLTGNLKTMVDRAVSDAVRVNMGKTSISNEISKAVNNVLPATITQIVHEQFQQSLVPAYQSATQAMFKQMQEAFKRGLDDVFDEVKGSIVKLEKKVNVIAQNRTDVSKMEAQFKETHDKIDLLQKDIHNLLKNMPEEGKALPLKETPKLKDPKLQIKDALKARDYQTAFTVALSSSNLQLVQFLLDNVSSSDIFINGTCSLSHAVLLSLMQQLSLDLTKDTRMKLSWIQESLLALDMNDTHIKDYVAEVLTVLLKQLENIYRFLQQSASGASGETDDVMKESRSLLPIVRLITRVVQSNLLEIQH